MPIMAAIFRTTRNICQCHRAFSTSSRALVSLQLDKNDPEILADVVPSYPYGPTRWYKQSRLGLYGGQRVQFGNNVGAEFKTKTRRTWHPNIFTKKLFSRAMNRYVQVRVSARVLRTIDKLGGLDEYLLGEKSARIKELGESGWWLRWAIMQTQGIKKRFREERIRLGLPERPDEIETEKETETDRLTNQEEDTDVSEEAQMEEVPMDDMFKVEQTADLPPIKFRVGPGQHVMLTTDGWRRTRPDPSYFADKRKEKLLESKFPNYVNMRMEAFEKELQERVDRGEVSLYDEERALLLKKTKRALEQELQQRLDKLEETRTMAKAGAKLERKRIKQEIARANRPRVKTPKAVELTN